MRLIFSCITTTLSVSFLLAQESQVEIVGRVINAESKDPVPFVHIVNNSKNVGTTSNTEGRFWIKMYSSDTLTFSAIGFNKYTFTLQENMDRDKLLVTIALNLSTMELQPVKVFAYRNEESLKKAIIDTEVPIEESNRMELPGFYYGPEKKPRDVHFGPAGIAVTGPFTLLSRKFGKEAKENKKVAKFTEKTRQRKQIDYKYNREVVKELTGLKEDKVDEFMIFCQLKDSFLDPASEYEIAVALNQCLVDFNRVTLADSVNNDPENH